MSGRLPELLGYPPARDLHTGKGDARAITVALKHIRGLIVPGREFAEKRGAA